MVLVSCHGKKEMNVVSFSNTLSVTFPGVNEFCLEEVESHKGHFFTLMDSGQTLGSCCPGTGSIPSSVMLIGHKLCRCTLLFSPVFLSNTVGLH